MFEVNATVTNKCLSLVPNSTIESLAYHTRENINQFLTENQQYIQQNFALLTLYRVDISITKIIGGTPTCCAIAGCKNFDVNTGYSEWEIDICLPEELEETKSQLEVKCLPRINVTGGKFHITEGFLDWNLAEDANKGIFNKGDELTIRTGEISYKQWNCVVAAHKSGGFITYPWVFISNEDLMKYIKNSYESSNLFQQASQEYSSQKYAAAIILLTQAINIDSTNYNAYSMRGDAKDEIGDYAGALEDYNNALRIYPNDLTTLNNKSAALYLRFDEFDKALETYQQALNLYPDDATTYALRAQCYMAQGNFESALKDVEKSLEIDPSLSKARSLRGNLYSLGMFTKYTLNAWNAWSHSLSPSIAELQQRGLEDWSQIMKPAPQQVDSHLELARKLVEEEDPHGALLHANLAIFHAPNNYEAYLMRGKLRFYIHYATDAFHDYSKAIEISPNRFQAYYERACLQAELGQHQKALEDFGLVLKLVPNHMESLLKLADIKLKLALSPLIEIEQALRLESDNVPALMMRASYFSDKEEHAKVIDETSKILAKTKIVFAYELRASAYNKLGEYKKAYEDYTTIIKLDSTNDIAYFGRGLLNIKRKQYNLAIKDFTDAIEKPSPPNQSYGRAFVKRGEAYLDNGKEALGLKDLDHAIESLYYPSDACEVKGNYFIKQGKWEEARDTYTKLISLDPTDSSGYIGRVRAIVTSAKQHLFLIETDEIFADIEKIIEITGDGDGRYRDLKKNLYEMINSLPPQS
jgi:tetratricopeptide (TPR) repeat protein